MNWRWIGSAALKLGFLTALLIVAVCVGHYCWRAEDGAEVVKLREQFEQVCAERDALVAGVEPLGKVVVELESDVDPRADIRFELARAVVGYDTTGRTVLYVEYRPVEESVSGSPHASK